ncbi:3-oxoacyl-[acyl-carrier-protein] synthase III C-terminal domain-containing protein [Virgibacillus sp. C22-A2]|uniref:3-oxoacyl-[acyl-carrier-protein] synthase III C-terminal domain-containing protein n=1 Tax=Virgibacillus tibetensis TaxID=3042313 RepID=A0ABU6KJW3_9BACI|nr:3-oxoacyl-[acyl-carrier-protein] synthase III C-terminal domain-containing protein [Virgibacillus sp. C22-A2]
MIGIESIKTYYPSNEIEISELKEKLNLSHFQMKLFTKIHGLEKIRFNEKESLEELLKIPIQEILGSVDPSSIKYIMYAHTVQTVTPYPINIIEEIKRKYGLQHAISFSITQHNCSSALTALDLCQYLLKNDLDKALIITGEKVFTPIAQVIHNTTIMGEASSGILVSKTSKENQLLSVERTILGEYYSGINMDVQQSRKFDKAYVDTLISTIYKAVEKTGLTLDEIKLILPHNVNRSSWIKLANTMNLSKEKIYLKNIAKLGHCFCSDPFINYMDACNEGLIKEGDYYLMISVGLGATFQVAVLKR